MSDTTGLKPISEEKIEEIAEAWFNRMCGRIPLKKYKDLHDIVKRNMCEDIRVILDLARELDEET